jgi:hypothetical protein
MVTKEVAEPSGGLKPLAATGAAVLIEGELAETPEGTKQVCVGGGQGAGPESWVQNRHFATLLGIIAILLCAPGKAQLSPLP